MNRMPYFLFSASQEMVGMGGIRRDLKGCTLCALRIQSSI